MDITEALSFICDHLPYLLDGFKVSLQAAVIAFLIGLILGSIVAFAKLSKNPIINKIATLYIEFLRGTPLLVQLMITCYGIPIALKMEFDLFLTGVFTMGINSSAYQAEIIRSGIKAIPQEQVEAAQSFGLSRWQIMRHIVLPQALRFVIPSLVNEFAIVLKDTSLLYVVGIAELMRNSAHIAAWTFRYFEVFITAALIYFVAVYIIGTFSRVLERKLAIPGMIVRI